MKKVCFSLFAAAFLLCAVSVIAGCGKADPVIPAEQIPDVPPSTRGQDGNFMPGTPGATKK
ncbi:MAG: hypothetical protein ACI87E_003529 [Mariniblastus sp.]|jgi:hypothetical protein